MTTASVEQLLQIGGAVLILVAYIAGLLGRLDARSWAYLTLNLVGSSVLAVLALREADWGFLLLEGVWALVTASSVVAKLRGGQGWSSPSWESTHASLMATCVDR